MTVLKEGQFLLPGFVDCHIHAVQFPQIGVGYDKQLLEWLDTYTFPLEKKYTNLEFAKHVFNVVVVSYSTKSYNFCKRELSS